MICVVHTEPTLILIAKVSTFFGIGLDREKPQNKNK